MKITLTGSLGNISKPLAEFLIAAGHEITVISSDPKKKTDIEMLGAIAAMGTIADTDFLVSAFKGADAIYTMVPPNWGVSNYREYIATTGAGYRDAIKASGVKHVVNLSSIGAHLANGTGPIAGLYDVEQALNDLEGVGIRHLRAGIFFTNYFFDIGMIRNMGIMGNNYSGQSQLVMVHPRDIAAAAAREIQTLFEGKSHHYIVGDECQAAAATHLLGAAIGKPELAWVQFSDEETFAGMTAAGMSAAIAEVYVEMGRAINSGILFEDFNRNKLYHSGSIKLSDFVHEFTNVYQSQQQQQ